MLTPRITTAIGQGIVDTPKPLMSTIASPKPKETKALAANKHLLILRIFCSFVVIMRLVFLRKITGMRCHECLNVRDLGEQSLPLGTIERDWPAA